jgi:SAM-dependent methyltransferase
MTDAPPKAAAKHDFSNIYDQPTPAAYVAAMLALSYRDPDFITAAAPHIHSFADAALAPGAGIQFLDLCCGYGMNAAWLREGLHGADMFRRIDAGAPVIPDRPTQWGRPLSVVGADIAENALCYAEKLGLHDGSVFSNLEEIDLSPVEAAHVARTDIIISTGSLSYIGPATIRRILEAIPAERPLLALFWPIVGLDISAAQQAMEAAGMTVKQSPNYQLQRQFADDSERDRYRQQYENAGVLVPGTLLESGLCVAPLLAERIPR